MITAEMLLAALFADDCGNLVAQDGIDDYSMVDIDGAFNLAAMADHLNRAQWRDDTPPEVIE